MNSTQIGILKEGGMHLMPLEEPGWRCPDSEVTDAWGVPPTPPPTLSNKGSTKKKPYEEYDDIFEGVLIYMCLGTIKLCLIIMESFERPPIYTELTPESKPLSAVNFSVSNTHRLVRLSQLEDDIEYV